MVTTPTPTPTPTPTTTTGDNNKTNKAIAFVVASALLASFMGSMGMMTQMTQEAAAAGHTGDRGLYYWHSARCSTGATSCNTLLTQTLNAEAGSTSFLIFHYHTNSPTQLQIDTMKAAVDSGQFTCSQVGMEGTSLAKLEELAPIIKENFKDDYSCAVQPWLGYNLEGHSPDAEEADEVGSYEEAKQIATANGLRLLAAPGLNTPDSDTEMRNIAGKATIYHLQVQSLQDDDANCQALKDELVDRVDTIRATYPSKIVTYQLSISQANATVDMLENCMDVTAGEQTVASGLTVWWGGAQIDNGDWEELMTYFETQFPSV